MQPSIAFGLSLGLSFWASLAYFLLARPLGALMHDQVVDGRLTYNCNTAELTTNLSDDLPVHMRVIYQSHYADLRLLAYLYMCIRLLIYS